jgi:alkylation response protein AidB-like acyl-CoA dehydrogenase
MAAAGRHPEIRIFILPVRQAELTGNWDVIGLRGTGSIDCAIGNVFVPEEYTHLQNANVPIHGGQFFTLGIFGISTMGHTGFALGIGRRVLDELRQLATAESGRPQTLPQRGGGESFLEQFGLAEAKVRAARTFVTDCLGGPTWPLKSFSCHRTGSSN